MTNEKLWSIYEDYTIKTSELVRLFSCAGLVFAHFALDISLISALFLIVLLVDVSHYFFASLRYKDFTRKQEIRFFQEHGSITHDKEGGELTYNVPESLDEVGLFLFKLKFYLLIVCYFLMLFTIVLQI